MQKRVLTLDNGMLTCEERFGILSKSRDIMWQVNVDQIKEMRVEGGLFKRLVFRIESPSAGGSYQYSDHRFQLGDHQKWIDAVHKEQKSTSESKPNVAPSTSVAQQGIKFCGNCGNQIAASLTFCTKCGAKVSA